MICPSCSALNAAGASRCSACGALLSTAVANSPLRGSGAPSGGTFAEADTLATATATPPPSASDVPSSHAETSQAVDFGPRYEVQALLGEGGMGAVYRAYDRELDRTVALKLIRPGLTADATLTQRFRQELLLASKISHKNILRIHDLGEAKGTRFISMAYIEGEDLHKLLQREGRLPIGRAVSIAKQLCRALEAAHAEGVVHRDLKPQNILLDKVGQIYVSDFGLAKSLESTTQLTMSGQFLGTPRYMSPEQALADAVDHRSDLYSFGLILYEMVTGDIPFSAQSTLQTMYQRVHEKPRNPKLLNPDLPDHLVQIIMRCLETNAAQRYQNAEDILKDLESGHTSVRSPGLQRPLAQISSRVSDRLSGRKRWYVALVGGAVLLAATLFAIPETRNIILGHQRASSAAAIGHGQPKSIAVLRFRVLGDSNKLQYVAEGVNEAVSAKLSTLREVRLAAPSAVDKVDQNQTTQSIAHNLGVNAILHGTVQGVGDRLRIVATLEDGIKGKQTWTKEFSGLQGDLLTLEDQIYDALLSSLDLRPSNAELANTTVHPTENIEAYDLYLRGRNAMRGQQDINNVRRAIRFYEDALKRDPGFALAYAGIADASIQMYRETKDKVWSERATGAAQQALRINDSLPQVHFTLGSVYSATGKNAEAVVELRRAMEMEPNSDEGYRRLGAAYLDIGRSKEAIQAYQRALQINPYYWENYSNLGVAYYSLGDYDNSTVYLRKVIELEPNNADGYVNLGAAFLQAGKFQEAIEPLEKAAKLTPTGDCYSNLGIAYFYLMQYEKAVTYYEKAVQMVPNSVIFVGNLAEAYRWAGRKQEAITFYNKAIALAYKDLQVNPRNAASMGALALWYAKKGEPEQARKFIQAARAIDSNNVDLIYFQAQILALANDSAGALTALREAFQKGLQPAIAEAEPDLKSLQAQPGFKDLVGQFSRK